MADPVVSWTIHHKRFPVAVAVLVVSLTSTVAQASPASVTGSLASRYTDNVDKTSRGESGTESTAQVGILHSSDPGRCQSDLDASLGYTYWLDNFYDPESSARGSFAGNCQIRPGFDWQVNDNLTEVLQSSRQNDTPDNRSRRNLFSTGPVLAVPLSPVDQLTISALYENTEFEDPTLRDSNRYTTSLDWNHLFDATLSGGLSASASRQELDSGAETDTETVNINVNKAWAASSLNASLGVTRRENRFASAEQSSDGLVGSIALNREINPSTSFSVSASRQITDQASDFTLQFGDVEFDLSEETGVEVTAIDIGLNKSFSDGTVVNVQGFGNRSDYLQSSQRENVLGMRFDVARSIRPQLSIRANGSYEYFRYEENLQDDQLVSASVGLNYNASRDLDFTAAVGHSTRKSDLPTSEYRENWIEFGLSYQFL